VARAFRPYDHGPPSTLQHLYLIRSQTAVVLIILITIAMTRYRSMWMSSSSHNKIIMPLGGLPLIAIAVLLVIRASQEKLPDRASIVWRHFMIRSVSTTAHWHDDGQPCLVGHELRKRFSLVSVSPSV
jgi:hypothetical protein